MNSLDIFYLTISIGFVVLVIMASYAIIHLVDTLKKVKVLLERVDDTARDLTLVKDSLKLGALSLVAKILPGNGGRR